MPDAYDFAAGACFIVGVPAFLWAVTAVFGRWLP